MILPLIKSMILQGHAACKKTTMKMQSRRYDQRSQAILHSTTWLCSKCDSRLRVSMQETAEVCRVMQGPAKGTETLSQIAVHAI